MIANRESDTEDVNGRTTAIRLEHITCRFGKVCALDDLSLDVRAGRVSGIIGPNGAGKTTIIDVLSGLMRPSSGRALILGHDVATDASWVRARIGVVSQETALYDELTPTQNLEFSLALYGTGSSAKERSRDRIEEVLALVGLSERRHDRVRTLSGGMQRRLTIARALLHEPDVLLLDEPTLGVDVEARHQIWNHVRSLRDAGKTILLATNYLDEAEALCDDVAILRAGRVIVEDSPAGLIARAGRCLEIECAHADALRLQPSLASHPNTKRSDVAGDRIVLHLGAKADPEELVRVAMEAVRVRGFRVRSPDLLEVMRMIVDTGA